jgi:hypothetical protein
MKWDTDYYEQWFITPEGRDFGMTHSERKYTDSNKSNMIILVFKHEQLKFLVFDKNNNS